VNSVAHATAAQARLVDSLVAGFTASVIGHANRPALVVDDTTYSYTELWRRATSLSATLQAEADAEGPALTAVLADRSAVAYTGILAALLRGHGYVPLGPQLPAKRTRMMLERSGCRALVADGQGQEQLADLLDGLRPPVTVLLPDCDDVAPLAASLPDHRFLGKADLVDSENWQTVCVSSDEPAYVMFTSGSTGVPKGVVVMHRNVRHFLSFVIDRYQLTERDRFSQMFDLVFDLSVFDLFAAWQCGGCICVPTRSQLMAPASFIDEASLTVWFSVPSVGRLMQRLGWLEAGAFSGLRVSLFCGEALTADLTEHWATAAPNSVVENLYGPTELTLACTYYKWEGESSAVASRHGVVPIGYPFADASVLIVDENLREVADPNPGELLVSGPQVAAGYYNDAEKTAAAFVRPPGHDQIFYRTGDRVCRESADSPLLYLGRLDSQIKIRGNRIELGEIEAALRGATGVNSVAAVGWPVTEAGADQVVAFVAIDTIDEAAVRQELARRLPSFAVPRRLYSVDALPLNSNGKVDRKALLRRCEEMK